MQKIKTKNSSKTKIIKKNLNILNILDNESFFIRLTNPKNIIKGIKDLNILKPENDEMNILKNEILKLSILTEDLKDDNYIKIIPLFFDHLTNLNELFPINSDCAIKIKKIIDEYNGNKNLTLKMISKIYEEKYSKKISLTQIRRILKNHLKMHYRKTVLKNPRLSEGKYILMTFIFLKIILRFIKEGKNFIYLDETGFSLNNENLKLWRHKGEEILGGTRVNANQRINLLMAISTNKILYGKYYTDETIKTNEFLKFLEDLLRKIENKDINNYVFILDNATFHCADKITKFVENNNMKFLFNVPYKSTFNAI